jgi:large subunit ribosomal protein L13
MVRVSLKEERTWWEHMSTTLAKNETVERAWHIIDAAGRPLGRTATRVAILLRGKHKADYTPNVDCGDYVIVINASQAVLTGNKLTQKYYRRHSGWVGGLKEVQYKRIMDTKPEFAVTQAVRGMLPKNKLADCAMRRLRVFKGAEHKHAAQKPEPWTRERV